MRDETKIWLNYAGENLESSKILIDSNLVEFQKVDI